MSTWSAIINNHLLHDTCEYISAAGSGHEWVANEWMLQTKPRQLYPRLSRTLRWVHDRKFSCSVNFFARSLLFVGLDVIFLKMVFPWLNALLYTLVKGVSVRTTVNSFLATLNINLSKQHKSYGYYLMLKLPLNYVVVKFEPTKICWLSCKAFHLRKWCELCTSYR